MAVGYLLPSALLIYALFTTGDALSCWVCSSDQMSQQYCRDPFNVSAPFVYTRDCSSILQSSPRPGDKQYCVKLVISQQLGPAVTHRYCMWGPEVNPQSELCSSPTSPAYEAMDHCLVCSTTGCNGSPRRFPTQPLRAALTLLGWLVLRS